jgi:hypothetical protein
LFEELARGVARGGGECDAAAAERERACPCEADEEGDRDRRDRPLPYLVSNALREVFEAKPDGPGEGGIRGRFPRGAGRRA